jgi:hypothetical protein
VQPACSATAPSRARRRRILKAHAFLRGAERVEPLDERALRFMLARRVPESLEPHVAAILEDALLERAPIRALPADARPATAAGEGGGGADAPVPVAGLETIAAPIESVAAMPRTRGDDDAASVDLVQALLGSRARHVAHARILAASRAAGGASRLDELLDADPVDALLFAQGDSSSVRVSRRERRNAGGTLAVLRDVSASMEGRLSRWAGQVVAGLVRTGARRRMRMGYVEFNHEAERFESGGAFFHRRYRRLLALASRRRAEGRTNYEAPLQSALSELRGTAGRERHVVLLTDGVPVLGDPDVRRERRLARELGVKVHTVFLGLGECPEVLDEISRETQGLCFVARPRPDGRLTVLERKPSASRRMRKHGLERLRELLDRHVVGHAEAKDALLLALVCREHIYLEGPPGSAKTRMAEVAARGSSLGFFFYQMHRDTRLSELVGDVVLERRPLTDGEGERIHHATLPGGILTAEICVLDDVSRAPGEALNVLLRILNERKFGESRSAAHRDRHQQPAARRVLQRAARPGEPGPLRDPAARLGPDPVGRPLARARARRPVRGRARRRAARARAGSRPRGSRRALRGAGEGRRAGPREGPPDRVPAPARGRL